MKFRNLKAEEIEIRVDRVTAKGVFLLLYKNARVDMAVLDETVGPENWQRRHEVINDNLFCTVSIWDADKKMWIDKQDVGVESFTAKEKGESSDSFKRACTCWGIGRELYNAPKIFVMCPTKPKDGRGFDLEDPYMFSDAKISHIKTVAGEIKEVAITDKKGSVIFSNLGKQVKKLDPTDDDEDVDLNAKINKSQRDALIARLAGTKYSEKAVCEAYKLKGIDDMTVVQLANFNSWLNRKEDEQKKLKK